MVTGLRPAKSDEISDCRDTLSKCDKALEAQIELNKLNRSIIADHESQSALQRQIIADKDRDLNNWYRRPEIVVPTTVAVLLVIGLTSGVLHGR